jgi:hemerythrin superfamily protein
MSNPISILSLMKQDHHEIESLIDSLTDSLEGSYDLMRPHFERFEWKLEKHLFIEEKAIFTFYEPEDVTQGFHMLPTIMKQHNFILNELSKMRKSVNNGKSPAGLDELKLFLEKHRDYEEKDLYPKLEDALTSDQKKKVVERIKEMS